MARGALYNVHTQRNGKTELRESMWADEQHEMKFFVERRLSIQVKASLIKNIQSGRLRQRER